MMNLCAWPIGPIGHEDHDRHPPGSHPDIERSEVKPIAFPPHFEHFSLRRQVVRHRGCIWIEPISEESEVELLARHLWQCAVTVIWASIRV